MTDQTSRAVEGPLDATVGRAPLDATKAGALKEARRVAAALRVTAQLDQADRDYAANIIDKLAQWVEDWHGLAVVAERQWTLKSEALKDLLEQVQNCDGTAQIDTDRALRALAGEPNVF